MWLVTSSSHHTFYSNSSVSASFMALENPPESQSQSLDLDQIWIWITAARSTVQLEKNRLCLCWDQESEPH